VKYCNLCASPVALRVPPGDNLLRYVCESCGTVHYQNPKNVVGCIPEWQDKVLLCKRAIEPRLDTWTLPAGFMENGETTAEAAARETLEEACGEVDNLTLYGLFSLPHINQVYLMYRGLLRAGKAEVGAESSEVALFSEQDIPWDNLAFPVIAETLRLFFKDRKTGQFPIHVGDIIRESNQQIRIIHY